MIAYVAGYGRSGSTLLDRLLSLFPGADGFGELAFLPDLIAAGTDASCSCGCTVRGCPLWSVVLTELAPLIAELGGPARAVALVRRFEGAEALWMPGSRWEDGDAESYRRLTRGILAAITRHLDGHAVLIDSSKSARLTSGRPVALARASGRPVRIIHLVRDGRAVLWSALRGDNRQLEAGVRRRPPFAALRTALGMIHANLAALRLWDRPEIAGALLVDYDGLVRDPEGTLATIATFLGLPPLGPLAGATERTGHRFAGNRNRLATSLTIVPDEEWRTRLPWRHRLLWWLAIRPVERLVARRARRGA